MTVPSSRFSRVRSALAVVLVSVLVGTSALSTSACSKTEPPSTRWNDAAAALDLALSAKAASDAASPPPKVEGGSFNAFFPKDGDGGKRVFVQEKAGFVEASWTVDGQPTGALFVSDVTNDAPTRAKFDGSKDAVSGFPAVDVGKNQTVVLVAGKYQAKVVSTKLDPAARRSLLAKFDLAGLSKL
ncbi:MAG: hypothetical protein U0169_16510 [Polyangiaceae bacterium]